MGDEVGAEEVGPIAAFAIALRGAGEIELGVLEKGALDFEACVDGIAEIFRDERAEKRGSHAGVKVLTDFEGDFDLFGKRQRNVLGDLVFGSVKTGERFEVWCGGL